MHGVKEELPEGKNFGERLRWLRKKTGHSLEHFGKLVGFDQSYLSRLERGLATNPSADFVLRVCAFYQVNPEWLRTGTGPMDEYSPVGSQLDEDTQFQIAFTIFVEEMTVRQLLSCMRKVLTNTAITERAKIFWVKMLGHWVDVKLQLEEKDAKQAEAVPTTGE